MPQRTELLVQKISKLLLIDCHKWQPYCTERIMQPKTHQTLTNGSQKRSISSDTNRSAAQANAITTPVHHHKPDRETNANQGNPTRLSRLHTHPGSLWAKTPPAMGRGLGHPPSHPPVPCGQGQLAGCCRGANKELGTSVSVLITITYGRQGWTRGSQAACAPCYMMHACKLSASS